MSQERYFAGGIPPKPVLVFVLLPPKRLPPELFEPKPVFADWPNPTFPYTELGLYPKEPFGKGNRPSGTCNLGVVEVDLPVPVLLLDPKPPKPVPGGCWLLEFWPKVFPNIAGVLE